MNNVDRQYLELLDNILKNGLRKEDRTGTGTISLFGCNMRFDMSEGFPLITSKKMYMKGIIHELIWFIRGDTNIKYLVDNNCNIWNGDAWKNFQNKSKLNLSKEEFIDKIKTDKEFSEKWGELGPIYGKQWRSFGSHPMYKLTKDHKQVKVDEGGVDQLQDLINDLKNNPDSRRLMVTAWNPQDLSKCVLPPCHYGFQVYTKELSLSERQTIFKVDGILTEEWAEEMKLPKRKISLMWNQRSCDFALGIPYNTTSYSLLLHLIAREVNMVPDELIFNGGDCHIYLNQIDGVKEQLKSKTYKLPSIKLYNDSIFDVEYDDIEIVGYEHSPIIKMPLSN